MTLEERLTALESQLQQHTKRRDAASAVMSESQIAIHQLQGAIALLQDLIKPADVPPPEKGNGPMVIATDG